MKVALLMAALVAMSWACHAQQTEGDREENEVSESDRAQMQFERVLAEMQEIRQQLTEQGASVALIALQTSQTELVELDNIFRVRIFYTPQQYKANVEESYVTTRQYVLNNMILAQRLLEKTTTLNRGEKLMSKLPKARLSASESARSSSRDACTWARRNARLRSIVASP